MACEQFRALCVSGEHTGQTSSQCPGYAQANLVILPKALAFDFLLFCVRNPKPCPLLEVLEAGNFLTSTLADSADIRHCIPKYRVFRDGELVEEVDSIEHLWQDDFVSFLLGCSFSFEEALEEAGFVPRHVQQGVNVPMFNTSIDCASAGVFADTHMVVSMRPYPPSAVAHVRAITEQFPRVHGSPVHVGDPSSIGIQDISRPDYGDAVELREGEVPVFWACGVTPQLALKQARPSIAITHAPGCMFVSDVLNEELEDVLG